ncbi:MAG: LysM peptidoglycan-binding domain-containing protein [Flavobacteriaceae bacterium]|jgi:LysM repeat protein|nr:LysM peptidoglycan-binding domain-containing protein [Flavobacteriaceae bacterium]
MKKYFILLPLLFIASFLASQQKKHVVEAKETLYGLSKKYNVTIDELKKVNPQLNQRTPQIGEILVIPDKNASTAKTDNKAATSNNAVVSKAEDSGESSEYISITVEPKQTLYGLSKKYDVTIEAIKKLNPNMGEKGPKIGEILKIPNTKAPIPNDEAKLTQKDKKPKKDNPEQQEATTVQATKNTIAATDHTEGCINIVLFLPLHTETESHAERNIATEFYSGVKLALDSISNKGGRIALKVLDSGNETKFKETLNTYDFSDTHLIIGPLFKSGILTVADKIKKTPIVSPFSSNDELDEHENVILYDTKEQTLAEKLVNEMAKKYSGEKVYVLYDDEHYKTALYFQSLILAKKSNAEVVLTKNADDIKPEQNLVTQEYTKIYAILASDKDALTSKYLDNITKLGNKQVQPVSLFYSSLFDTKKYEEKLVNSGLIYSDTNYVNEHGFNEQKTIGFYKKKYCNTPGKYAVVGFDVTYDIINRLDEKGSISNYTMKTEEKRLSNKYSFIRIKKNGAWINQGARIIQLLK